MRWYVWATMAGLLAVTGAGCDKDEVPPEILRAREQQQREAQRQAALSTSKPMPTTRELLASEKRPLRLGSFPLTIMAPKSWTIGSLGGAGQIVTLSGPASSGEITIQLIDQQAQLVPETAINATFEAAKKDAAAKPFPVNKVELRPLGPGKLLEQRMLSGTFREGKPEPEVVGDVDTGVKDERGVPLTTKGVINPRMLKWNFTIFMPASQGKFSVRGLNFMSLRLSEFEQDREFLEQMMSTLQYTE